ncbi:MAG: FUSC family membrane protein [Segetibacter sp.]
MDYLKTYKSFINSHYLSEGVRITAGVLLPAFIMSYFDMLSTGIPISLGALMVSVADSAGPIHHRRNGMLVCTAAIFIVTLLSGFFENSPFLLAFFLFIASFFFSMIGIYGARAGSIGTAALIILTLSMDTRLNLATPIAVIQHSVWIASGGIWYTCFSILLYSFRPYRLAQQALGDYIQSTAEYLLIRSELYNKQVNYESTYQRLLQQQVIVQHKQTELTELLFKTRRIVQETTIIGRTLVMIHLEVIDIFESIMMSHQEYSRLHEYFDETDILNDYEQLAKELAKELDEVGIAVKSGKPSRDSNSSQKIIEIKEKLGNLRLSYLKPNNIEGFISLNRILENIQDLSERLSILQNYTHYDVNLKKAK